MKSTTVILPIFTNDSEAIRSIVSVLNSETKPDNLCLVTTSQLSENRMASINAMFKSCCDGGEYSEDIAIDKTVIKKVSSTFTMYNLILHNQLTKHPNYYAVNYLKNKSDIFLTLTEGSVYKPEGIGKFLNKLKDPYVGAVYSDYIMRGKQLYLPTIHPMIKTSIPIGEIAFRVGVIDTEQSSMQNGDIVNDSYSKSIVSHIPESLFIA